MTTIATAAGSPANVRLQPRWLMVSSAAVGCKPMLLAGSLLGAECKCSQDLIRQAFWCGPFTELRGQFLPEFRTASGQRLEYRSIAV
jgi:hypothetical protein